jgi:broad specificity phosphatase PhoE
MAKKGETYFADEEARKTVKGIPDHKIPLTKWGIIQAEQTGDYLWKNLVRPDYVYHSGYLRTIQTLDGILGQFPEHERLQINVRMNQFIRERDSGYTYDMTTEEAEFAFPYLKDYWKTHGGFFARPPGGESLSDVSGRVYTFLNTLFRDRAGKRVWVVTHGGTLRAFRFILDRWNYEQALAWPKGQTPKNCGVTIYNYSDAEERLVLQEYNTVHWH